jgi:hypothetical protein
MIGRKFSSFGAQKQESDAAPTTKSWLVKKSRY